MDKEKAILNYMKSLEISREEAEQLWEDDQEDYIGEEAEEMTIKAKEVVRTIHGAETNKTQKKKNAPRERKPNEAKRELMDRLFTALGDYSDIDKLIVTNIEKYIEFDFGGEHFTLNLIQNRKPKK